MYGKRHKKKNFNWHVLLQKSNGKLGLFLILKNCRKREIVMEKNIVTILQINLMIKEVEEPNKTIIRKTNVENYMIISKAMVNWYVN